MYIKKNDGWNQEKYAKWQDDKKAGNVNDYIVLHKFLGEWPLVPYITIWIFLEVPTIDILHVIFESDYEHRANIGYQEVQEEDEIDVIRNTDAIINPRTMMVESLNASITNGAVL